MCKLRAPYTSMCVSINVSRHYYDVVVVSSTSWCLREMHHSRDAPFEDSADLDRVRVAKGLKIWLQLVRIRICQLQ